MPLSHTMPLEKRTASSHRSSARMPKIRDRQRLTAQTIALSGVRRVHRSPVEVLERTHRHLGMPVTSDETKIFEADGNVPAVPFSLAQTAVASIFPAEEVVVLNSDESDVIAEADRPTKELRWGDLIRRRREQLGMSVSDAAHAIKSPAHYIDAFEEGRYGVFSAKVYAEGFLKKLLVALALQNHEQILGAFREEWRLERNGEIIPLKGISRKHTTLITPRHLALVLAAVVTIAVLGFLGLRLIRFAGAPELTVREPRDHEILDEPVVRVSGTIGEQSQLTVNNREMKIDDHGNFDERLFLRPGVNTLEFRLTNQLKKTTTATRRVLVE